VTKRISDALLLQFGEVVARYLGLHFPKERWLDLQRGVWGAAQECGCQLDLDRYVQGLLSPALTQGQLEVLASCLTVGETYFFREKRSLEILERDIVPELVRERASVGRAIRIWSAGCSTGEEPYSIAIVLSKLMAGLKKWDIEILATDLNAKSLAKASQGIYGEWSFRGVPPRVRSTYFEEVEEGRWAISPAVKKMVTFAQLNLMDDIYPPVSNRPNGLDVILCRNVLMYLTPEAMRKVIRQLHRFLASDGWLIVSPTETSQELFSEFTSVSFGDVTFYRKSAARLPMTLAPPVCAEGRSGVPLPERIVETLEPTRTSPWQTSQKEDSHREPGPQNTAVVAASYGQALALYEQGLYEEVEEVIRALPSDDGNHASAVLLLARAYANRGKLASALVLCDRAIAADKMAARAYYLRATILQEQGCLPEALLAFKQTVYAEPEFMLGHFALGSLALKQRRLKESEKHFANVLLLLARYQPEDIVPESEGLPAGRLREMIVLSAGQGVAATETGEARIRVLQQVRNLERSRR
jgi:chemotaxis protein methyltransferase CheR